MGTFDCLVKIGLHLQKIGAGFDQPTSIPKVCVVTLSLGLCIPLSSHKPTYCWTACGEFHLIGPNSRDTAVMRVWWVIDCGTLLPKGACFPHLDVLNQCKPVLPGNLCPTWWSALLYCAASIWRGYDAVTEIIFPHCREWDKSRSNTLIYPVFQKLFLMFNSNVTVLIFFLPHNICWVKIQLEVSSSVPPQCCASALCCRKS